MFIPRKLVVKKVSTPAEIMERVNRLPPEQRLVMLRKIREVAIREKIQLH